MLFKSLKDNDALLAVLLGGNPGFFPEAAPATPNTVPESASRLSLLPKGVSMLLKRWTKLQHVERERERERDRDREASGRGAGDTSDILLNLSLSGLSDRQYGHGAAFSAGTSHQSRCNQSAGSAVKSRRVTTQPPANGSVRAGYLSQVGGVGSIVAKRENDGEFDGDAVEWSVRSTADSENMTFDIDKSWCEEGSGILDMGSEDLEIPSTGASTSAATGQGLGFGPGDADAESSAYGEDLWGLTDRVTDHSTRTLPRCKLLLTDFLQDASVSTEVPRQPYYRGPTAHAPYLPGVLSTDFTDPVSVTASAASTRAWPVPFGWDPSFTPQVAPLQTTKSRKGEGRKLLPSSIPAGTAHVGRKDDIVFLDSLGSSVGKLRRRHSSEGVRVSRPASSYEFEVRRQGGESLRLSKGDAFKDKEIGGHRPVRSVRGKVSLGRYHTARSVSQAAKEKVKHPDTRSSGVFLIRAIHTHSGNSSGTPRAQPDGDRVRVERESRRPPRRLCKPSLQVALKHTRKGKAQKRLDKAAPGPSTPSELFAVQQVALDQIMGHFSESVMEISESLGNVSAQLRDVTATISESMSILELSRSRGSSPNKSLTPGSASKVDPKQHRIQRDVPTPTHTRGTQMQREEQADDSEALYHDMLFNDGHGSDSGSGDGGSGGDGVVSPSKKGLSEGEYLDSKKRTTMRQEERKREKEGGREEREREVEETASQERETSPLALPPLLVESHPSPVKTVLPRSDDKVLARSDDEVAWARLGLGLGSGVNSLEGVKSPSGRTQVPAGPYMVTSPGIFISERGTGLSSPELCVYEDDREISHREIALMIREGLARKLRAVLRPSVP